MDIRSKISTNTAKWVCRECYDHSICHFKSCWFGREAILFLCWEGDGSYWGQRWLEVYRVIPATCEGNFNVSVWSKLPFSELDFGLGLGSLVMVDLWLVEIMSLCCFFLMEKVREMGEALLHGWVLNMTRWKSTYIFEIWHQHRQIINFNA